MVWESYPVLRFDAVVGADEGPAKGEGDSVVTYETFDGVTAVVTMVKRDDENCMFVGAWEHGEKVGDWNRVKEPLVFEAVEVKTRSYK